MALPQANEPQELWSLLAAIVESSDDAIISKSLEGTITSWNRSAERIFGYTAQEAIGRHITLIAPPDKTEDMARILERIRRGERVDHYETIRQAKDGRLVEVALTVSPIRNQKGEIVGASKVARDITERKRVEAELRRKQQELTDFVENAPIGLHWLDKDGTILWANRSELELLGVAAEQYIGRNVLEFHEHPDAFAEALDRLKAGEPIESYEATLKRSDGSVRYAIISSNAYWEDGIFRHTRGFTRDITLRKMAEQELKAQRELLQVTLASIGDAVITTDAQGHVTYLNGVAARLTGWTEANARGKPLDHVFRIINEKTRRPAENPAHRALQSGLIVGLANHTVLISDDGTERPVDDSAAPIKDANGNVHGVVLVFRDVTERRRSEHALRASEERFRHAADHAPVMIWVADTNKQCTWLNRPWLEFVGRTLEDELGEGWTESIHPDDRARCQDTFAAAFAARQPFRVQYRLRRNDGVYRWVFHQAKPLYDSDGQFTGYIGSSIDVTEQVTAVERQRLLAETGRILTASLDYEATLASLCKLIVPVIADWSTLDLLLENGEVRRIELVHSDPDRIGIAREFRHRYPPRPGDQRGVRNVLRTGEAELYADITDEMLVQAARDEEHLALLRKLGLRSLMIVPLKARGRTLGAMTLATSESGRRYDEEDLELVLEIASRAALAVDNARLLKESQEAVRLREQALELHRTMEQHLTLLVEASGSLSASLDLGSVLNAILLLSRRLVAADAYAVWRFRPTAGQWGIDLASGLTEEFQQLVIRELADAPAVPEKAVVAEDVRTVPLLDYRREAYEREGIRSLLAVPLKLRGRTRGTLVFYYREPHVFSEVEVRLATALSNLAASAVSTAELYSEVREGDRRKDEFLAMLAHELRNPLAAITSALDVSRNSPSQEDLEWASDVIERQVKHLSRLIDDLLDVSRITQGKIQLRKEPIDAVPVITSALETVRPLVQDRKHKLTVSMSPTLPLSADPTRLEQIVVNLLTNAAKYTESGGHISLAAELEGSNIVITVRDSGVGIPPEVLPKMFELFIQGERSIARSEGGLGIGLTLVQKLAEMHGGSVCASSEGPGKGSEFTVRLPALLEQEAKSRREPRAQVSRGRDHKILIVDDSLDTAGGLDRLLRRSGYQVQAAHDGPAGLELASRMRPDIVLLDIGLPLMDGFEVARRLRQEEWGRNAVLIAISGYGQEEDRKRSREAGFNYHLIKPIEYEELAALLDHLHIASKNNDPRIDLD